MARTKKEIETTTDDNDPRSHRPFQFRMSSDLLGRVEAFVSENPELFERLVVQSGRKIAKKKEGDFDKTGFGIVAFEYFLAHVGKRQTSRVVGAAIDETVERIMTENRRAAEADEWYRITIIGNGTLREAGHNPKTIMDWLKVNRPRLEAHAEELKPVFVRAKTWPGELEIKNRDGDWYLALAAKHNKRAAIASRAHDGTLVIDDE